MKGKQPAPTAMKVFRGEKDKRRINMDEPNPIPGKPLPGGLKGEALKCWKRTLPWLLEMGVMGKNDVEALRAYCRIVGRWEEAERLLEKEGIITTNRFGERVKNPTVTVIEECTRQMRMFASEFGLTPSSRSRLVVLPSKQTAKKGIGKFLG